MNTLLSRRLGAGFAAIGLLAALSACGDDGDGSSAVAADCEPTATFDTVDEGKLTIAAPDFPPYYSGTASSGDGIDKQILDKMAEDFCLEPVYLVAPGAGVIESVSTGRADIAAGGWYTTDERGEVVNQSDPTYLELPTLVAKDAVSNINDLKGKKVGTITGYTWVEEAQKLFGDDLKLYQSSEAVLSDIAAGRLDAGLVGGIDAPYTIKNKAMDIVATTMDPDPAIDSSVNPALPNYPHTKGNDDLTAAINAELATMHEDGFIADTLEGFGLDPALADVQPAS